MTRGAMDFRRGLALKSLQPLSTAEKFWLIDRIPIWYEFSDLVVGFDVDLVRKQQFDFAG